MPHRKLAPPLRLAIPRRLLKTSEAAQFLDCGVNTLEQDRMHGATIPFVKMGRSVRYDLADLEVFLAANKRRSTSEPAL